MKELLTANEIVEVLGGTNAVSDLVGSRPSAVSNWRRMGFPPKTFIALQAALAEKGFSADPSIWKMVGAPHKEPSAAVSPSVA